MNKQLMLAIIVVSMIPGIVASAHGISGFLVANASDTNISTNVSTNASHVINIVPGAYTLPNSGYASFYALATVLLIIAMAYLLNEYRKDEKKRASSKPKKTQTVTKSSKNSKLKISHIFDSVMQKARSTKIDNDKAEKYMVYIVGAVAVVAILILIF